MQKAALMIIAAVGLAASAAAQDQPSTVEFAGASWRVKASEAAITRYLGRESLRLKRGQIWLDQADFSDGVIEFDVAYNEAPSFVGLMWRAESDERYEDTYVRAHLNAKPDAFQYTPIEHGLSAWQIFADGNAQTAVDEKFGAWNHVKLVAIGDKAEVYFNSDKPALHIPDLKTDIAAGRIGLWVLSLADEAAFISNFSVRALTNGDRLVGAPVESPAPPTGLIAHWNVSSPFAEALVADALLLNGPIGKDLDWRTLGVETNGVANLARLCGVEENADTVFVRLNIKSERAQMKELRFGYSDRVRIYLNGKRIYFGDAGWRVRDYRFLGTVGFFDSAGLDLKKGENELLVAVSETFGGWAWAGAIEDRDGVRIAPETAE